MGTRYLLDTNVVLEFMGKKFPAKPHFFLSEIIDNEINISAINKIELLGFSFVEQDLIDFVSFAEVYPIDDETINKTIDIRKKHKIKLPDAIVAATCLINKYVLLTRNVKDFVHIADLQIVNPWDL